MIQKPNFLSNPHGHNDKNSVMEILFLKFFVSAYINFEGQPLEKSIDLISAQARMDCTTLP